MNEGRPGSRSGDVLRFDEGLTGDFVYRGAAGFSGGSDNTEARILGARVLVNLDGEGSTDLTLTLTGLAGADGLSAGEFVFL